MESFVYKELNTASRDRDSSKVENYGPFAWGLYYTYSREDKGRVVFRGIHIKADEVSKYYRAHESKGWLELKGWSSCSLDYNVALEFSKANCKERVSVIFTIEIARISYPILEISNYARE